VGRERGLGVLAPAGARSPTVTALTLGERAVGGAVVTALGRRGWTIANGYGKLRDRTIRIGHMGDHTVEETCGVLAALQEVLEEMRG
jgi:aspartate aminotransferase-like enzyme